MPKRKAPKGCFWRGNTLWGRIQANGTDVKWSLRTDDPALAKSRRHTERARQVAIARYGDHRRTFQEAMDSWVPYIQREVSPKTAARYATSLTVLQPLLEGVYLDEIDKKFVGEIVEWRQKTPTIPTGKKKAILVTNATIKRDLTALSSVLDYAVDQDWREDNPVMSWLRPGKRKKSRLKERRDPIVLPDPAHIQMVVDEAKGLFRELIRAALATGARQSELSFGKRQQFDRAARQYTIIGKRNKRRAIDLMDAGDDFGFEVFAGLPATIEGPWLFWHRDEARGRKDRPVTPYRNPSTNFARLVRSVAKKAQKQEQDFRPFTFHDLRHVHAVNWLKGGRSIYVLQQRLGHSTIQMTERYLEFLTHEEKLRVTLQRQQQEQKQEQEQRFLAAKM